MTHDAACEDASWIAGEPPCAVGAEMPVWARLRHRQPLQSARMTLAENGCFTLRFDAPQRAVTPGQAAVLYTKDECLGGGTIR